MSQDTLTMRMPIYKVRGKVNQQVEDQLLKEHVLRIYLEEECQECCCTNILLKELAIGNLYTTRRINLVAGGYDIAIKREENKTTIYCHAKAVKELRKRDQLNQSEGELTFSQEVLMQNMEQFASQSQLFLETGNMHSAAFLEDNKIKIFTEDIGRHNALDKLVGKALMEQIDLSRGVVLLSGRVPVDMMEKLIVSGVKMVISISAPTFESVQLAISHGVTLAGFVRKDKMNIYSHSYRIIM